MTTEKHPETLLEAVRHFADPDTCQAYLAAKRWPGGVACPHCGNQKLGYAPSVRLWRCAPCKKRFSVKVGTIFEASPLGLDKWLPCVWMLVNAKNGVSSCEMARSLGVTQKTAWFMLHRVCEALRTGNFQKMKGIVEADETFVGGSADFMHKKRKKALGIGRGFTVKTIVMGLLEHGADGESRVRAAIIQDTKKRTLLNQIRISVETGATLHTDAWVAYQKLGPEFVHKFVDHAVRYVEGQVHTNGLENFWCLLKRMLKSTYVHVNAEQLQAYLDEQGWRYNQRKKNDGERFATVAGEVKGRRLTYRRLISRRLSAKP